VSLFGRRTCPSARRRTSMSTSKVAPEPEGMARGPTVRLQPRVADNGCCLRCCGANAGPVDVKKILVDGGKFLQLSNGRIVEYFVFGAPDTSKDAPTYLTINGTVGTGWMPANLPMLNAVLQEKGLRGLSITIPGYGFTSMFPVSKAERGDEVYGLGKWPAMDIEPVLEAEGLTGPLLVEGTSYGAGLALAVASHFGARVSHLHLHVPYIPGELRKELSMPVRIMDDGLFDKDTSWANSCSCDALCCHCCCWWAGCCCLRCFPTMLDDETTKATEEAAPGSTRVTHYDMARCYRHGANSHGIVHNMVGGLISKNWGFDVRSVDAAKMKVMVSYNLNDQNVGAKELLPENPHGEWLAEFFTKTAAKCQVNVGGTREGKKNQHGAQMPKLATGAFLRQLLEL
jgi:hypothetical protein